MSTTGAAVEALVIRRTYKAPRERVFDAWVKPEIFRRWMGRATSPSPRCRSTRVSAASTASLWSRPTANVSSSSGRFATIAGPNAYRTRGNGRMTTARPRATRHC